MRTQATQENILKYYNTLKELHKILNLTNRISMMKFSEQQNVSKSLSTVLSKGGVIECYQKGAGSKWRWTTIEPTREMAIKTLKELALENPPRKNKRGGKRDGAGRKTKSVENRYLDSCTLKLLFGLIKINISMNYKK